MSKEEVKYCPFCGTSKWNDKGEINFEGSSIFDALFKLRRHNLLCYKCKKEFVIFEKEVKENGKR